ncbi:MAG: hypothetical protein Q9164_006204 [Protoblastenia rupestris]
MVPKPFPYPFSIGTDICKVNRIGGLLRYRDTRERFIRRIITSLEWPNTRHQFQRVRLANLKEEGSRIYRNKSSAVKKEDVATAADAKDESDIWGLPDLYLSDNDLHNLSKDTFHKNWASQNLPLVNLVHYLAGRFDSLTVRRKVHWIDTNGPRWAAKEAVIKTHIHRKLSMQDISIITPRFYPSLFSPKDALNGKPVALIDPPCDTIVMGEQVAKVRALRGFGPRSQHLNSGGKSTEASMTSGGQDKDQVFFERRSQVQESERQIADVNISHDGDYAVAVCIAASEPDTKNASRRISDDGMGPAKHEPQWGDEGWFANEEVAHEDEDPLSVPDDRKKAVGNFVNSQHEKMLALERSNSYM